MQNFMKLIKLPILIFFLKNCQITNLSSISKQKIPKAQHQSTTRYLQVKKFTIPPHFQGFSSSLLICYFATNCGLFLYVYDKTIARRIFSLIQLSISCHVSRPLHSLNKLTNWILLLP